MSGPNDPKMKEMEAKLTTTVAMGMKMSRVSCMCWQDQVAKERQIREEWKKVHDPDGLQREAAIIERAMQREKERKAVPPPPERSLLYDGVSKDGKGRLAYLKARLQKPPQEKQEGPLTASQIVGWSALEIPPVRTPIIEIYRPIAKGPNRRQGTEAAH